MTEVNYPLIYTAVLEAYVRKREVLALPDSATVHERSHAILKARSAMKAADELLGANFTLPTRSLFFSILQNLSPYADGENTSTKGFQKMVKHLDEDAVTKTATRQERFDGVR